nr:ComF family protein [Streptomyces harenosi]
MTLDGGAHGVLETGAAGALGVHAPGALGLCGRSEAGGAVGYGRDFGCRGDCGGNGGCPCDRGRNRGCGCGCGSGCGCECGGAGWEAARREAVAGGSGAPGERAVLLVPVPSARRAVRARGHDPARRIALAAAGELRRSGAPARMLAALRQRRAVADQSGLGSRQRRDNLAGALAVVPGAARLLRGAAAVVLVDDVMTTGASLAEAARAVRASVSVRAGAAGETALAAGRASGPGAHTAAGAAVYSRAMGEGRGERMGTAPEERSDRAPAGPERAGANEDGEAIGRVMCAAVVAASPESFEINRN